MHWNLFTPTSESSSHQPPTPTEMKVRRPRWQWGYSIFRNRGPIDEMATTPLDSCGHVRLGIHPSDMILLCNLQRQILKYSWGMRVDVVGWVDDLSSIDLIYYSCLMERVFNDTASSLWRIDGDDVGSRSVFRRRSVYLNLFGTPVFGARVSQWFERGVKGGINVTTTEGALKESLWYLLDSSAIWRIFIGDYRRATRRRESDSSNFGAFIDRPCKDKNERRQFSSWWNPIGRIDFNSNSKGVLKQKKFFRYLELSSNDLWVCNPVRELKKGSITKQRRKNCKKTAKKEFWSIILPIIIPK